MEFTHFDEAGNARMVDVSGKDSTEREAVASGTIRMSQEAFDAVMGRRVKKGDVLTVSQVAGIMAAKRTSDLIPMCHSLNLTHTSLIFETNEENCSITAFCRVKTGGRTGVEMEALTGVSVALLTIYDMCKAIDRAMVMGEIRLIEKSGGKSGHYRAEA
ncbi:MAG: cyclic pyranopterin monophosphate synthase MoaC [Lachnospiraceae bacterium]|nr:cyclic pyranopterin monophosphate synthase MoaC [Lachnospiraceae bacterium]